MEIQKQKPKKKIDHLINWYFGNYCAKCGKIGLKSEDYGQKCLRKMKKIKEGLNISEMTHKEFIDIIRHNSFCHPFTRKFSECEVWERKKFVSFLSFLVLQFQILA